MHDIAHATANRLVDAFIDDGEADLVRQFAMLPPAKMICTMLDVPLDDASKLSDLSRTISRVFDTARLGLNELQLADAACAEIERYFRQIMAARRAHPGADMVSRLLAVIENGVTLTDA
jgi:cytochrome P450